jgi:hypothetical protein
MYTNYVGLEFINDYINDRYNNLLRIITKSSHNQHFQDYIDLLNDNKRLDSLIKNNLKNEVIESLKRRKHFPQYEQSASGLLSYIEDSSKVNAKQLFDNIAYLILLKKKEEIIPLSYILDVFTKKFEVFKRIFEEYSGSLKKIGENYQKLDLYIIISFTMVYYYYSGKILKYLNVSLKLNDLICSSEQTIGSKDDLIILFYSIILELEAINNLMMVKKII